MSIVKEKEIVGAMPSDAYLSFNGQHGINKLTIDIAGENHKLEPKTVTWLVLDEDFSEIEGIKLNAPQDQGVESNVQYGTANRFFVVKMKNGTSIAAGPWKSIKQKVDNYGGKFVNFSFALLMQISGTEMDDVVNAKLQEMRTIVKVQAHGRTSMEMTQLRRRMKKRDLAGCVITSGSFKKVSGTNGIPSMVPEFKGLDISSDADYKPWLDSGIKIFNEMIAPYIAFIESQDEADPGTPMVATANDFVPPAPVRPAFQQQAPWPAFQQQAPWPAPPQQPPAPPQQPPAPPQQAPWPPQAAQQQQQMPYQQSFVPPAANAGKPAEPAPNHSVAALQEKLGLQKKEGDDMPF